MMLPLSVGLLVGPEQGVLLAAVARERGGELAPLTILFHGELLESDDAVGVGNTLCPEGRDLTLLPVLLVDEGFLVPGDGLAVVVDRLAGLPASPIGAGILPLVPSSCRPTGID